MKRTQNDGLELVSIGHGLGEGADGAFPKCPQAARPNRNDAQGGPDIHLGCDRSE